jgi:hypothetical protein
MTRRPFGDIGRAELDAGRFRAAALFADEAGFFTLFDLVAAAGFLVADLDVPVEVDFSVVILYLSRRSTLPSVR